MFVHALIQEATYASLPRAALHGTAATRLSHGEATTTLDG
jgi:hypothetical protein